MADMAKCALAAQDPDMNALLPFGEYVPPERYSEGVPHFMLGLEAWELERLLQRLAVTNSASSSRRPRTRGRSSRAYSLPGSRIGEPDLAMASIGKVQKCSRHVLRKLLLRWGSKRTG